MNSKSIQYHNARILKSETLAFHRAPVLAAMIGKLSGFLFRSDIEKSQAEHRIRRKQEAQDRLRQDIVNTLPVEENLRLGMYRFMN